MKKHLMKNFIKYKNINQYKKNHLLKFGKFGIKSKNFSLILQKQLDSFYFIILKKFREIEPKKKIKIWNCLLLNLNLTKLSPESRMGKGKGQIYSSAIFLKPGTIIFEFDNIDYYKMINVFFYLQKKLPFSIILIK